MVVHKLITKRAGNSQGLSSVETEPVRALPDGRLPSSEAARYLGVAEKTMANWRSQGRGPRFLKRARRVWYRQEWLDAWVQSGDKLLDVVRSKPKWSPTVASKQKPLKDQPVGGADICTLDSRRHQTSSAKSNHDKKGSGKA